MMPRPGSRATLEAGLRFDVNRLSLRPNRTHWSSWHYGSGLVVSVEAKTAVERGTLVLRQGGQEQWFELETLQRPFGGRQWFVRCPRSWRRVSTLWMPPGAHVFASRHAWGPRRVAYASQFQDRCQRAWSTLRKIAKHLGESDSYDLPDRPTRMHHRTYERLAEKFENAEAVIEHEAALTMYRLLQRYGPRTL